MENRGKLKRVGKTSIVQRLVKREFNEQYRVTVGADQIPYKMIVNDKEYSITIWDTAG